MDFSYLRKQIFFCQPSSQHALKSTSRAVSQSDSSPARQSARPTDNEPAQFTAIRAVSQPYISTGPEVSRAVVGMSNKSECQAI